LNQIKNFPPAEPASLFYLAGNMKDYAATVQGITRDQFIAGYGSEQYRQASVLEMYDGERIDPSIKGKLVTPIYRAVEEDQLDTMPPVIFDAGQWKFLIVKPPT